MKGPAESAKLASSVLVMGEALVDVVREADGSETRAPGGSPMNVAVTLGRLGVPVTLHTALGDDADGDAIAAHVAASGVTLSHPRVGRTSSATATIGVDGSAHYEFDIDWRLTEKPRVIPSIVHTGSIALFLEPGASMVSGVVKRASRKLVSIDPNIRPTLLGSPDVAREMLESLFPWIDVLKVSDEDTAWLYPDVDPHEAMQRIHRAGVPLVILTRGAQGSVLQSGPVVVEVESPSVQVADTIGAGDSYMGALLYGIAQEMSDPKPLDALSASTLFRLGRFAAATAAITVTRRGANPPMYDEVHSVLSGSPLSLSRIAALGAPASPR